MDDVDIDDGPLPRWSGLVWVPLLLLSVAFFAALGYGLWRLFF